MEEWETLDKAQAAMRVRWADKKYARRYGTVSKELRGRFNEEFPNATLGDNEGGMYDKQASS